MSAYTRFVAISGLALTVMASPALGQASPESQEHRGFWITFGFGGGSNLSDGFDGERLGGGAGYVRLGGTVNQRVLLGFEGIGWVRDRDANTLARGNGAFVALFYPSSKGGGFLKGGIGLASASLSNTTGNTTTTTTKNGFGFTAGGGWDLRLGRNLYLTPNVDFLLQAFESDTDPVLGNIPGTNTILLFTLGLGWH